MKKKSSDISRALSSLIFSLIFLFSEIFRLIRKLFEKPPVIISLHVLEADKNFYKRDMTLLKEEMERTKQTVVSLNKKREEIIKNSSGYMIEKEHYEFFSWQINNMENLIYRRSLVLSENEAKLLKIEEELNERKKKKNT